MRTRNVFNFQNEIDKFFGYFDPRTEMITAPLTDLYENNDSYKIVVNLPDVKKEQIKIESDAETLEISLLNEEISDEIKDELESKDQSVKYFLKERPSKDLSRKINFSKFIDPSKSDLSFENGVLTIIVSKSENAKKMTLNIT